MLSQLAFWRRKKRTKTLGVYLATDRAWVYVPAADGEQPVERSYLIQDHNWQALFQQIASDFPHSELRLGLSSLWYQLLTVDKPEVADENLHNSLLWAVKDMVNIPTQFLHLDYFEPAVNIGNKLSVVVVDKRELQKLVHQIIHSELTIAGISTEEMLTCHAIMPDPQARLLISQYAGQDLLFTVVRNRELCMQRRVRGFAELNLLNHELLGLGTIDNLSLELQRSMDYFESQLRQPPIANMQLLLEGDNKPLIEALSVNFNQQIIPIAKLNVGMSFARFAFQEWEVA